MNILSKVPDRAWVRLFRTEALAGQDNQCCYCHAAIM
jgi:hypothetical protein